MVKMVLHMEGMIIFIGAMIIYGMMDYNWWLFIILLLAPDVSMLGYLKNEIFCSYIYYIFHTYVLAFLVIGIGYWTQTTLLIGIGIIWVAHIGMDRLFGFGLKDTN